MLDDFVAKQYEVNRAGMTTTLAPVRAVVDKYALGLREHAISVVCALLQSFKNVESHFEGSSTDQAVAALLKANPTDLDVVYRTALAHTRPAPRDLAKHHGQSGITSACLLYTSPSPRD